jgi:hypothetical protein
LEECGFKVCACYPKYSMWEIPLTGYLSFLCKLVFSVIYGQNVWKVYKKYMSPFNLSSRKYSRGAT